MHFPVSRAGAAILIPLVRQRNSLTFGDPESLRILFYTYTQQRATDLGPLKKALCAPRGSPVRQWYQNIYTGHTNSRNANWNACEFHISLVLFRRNRSKPQDVDRTYAVSTDARAFSIAPPARQFAIYFCSLLCADKETFFVVVVSFMHLPGSMKRVLFVLAPHCYWAVDGIANFTDRHLKAFLFSATCDWNSFTDGRDSMLENKQLYSCDIDIKRDSFGL